MSFGNEVPELVIVPQDDTELLTIYVKEDDGSAYDLTGSTVKFFMAKDGATAKKAGGDCVLTVPADGVCTYEWSSGETDTVGSYLGQVKITKTATSKVKRSRKFMVEIESKIPEA